VLAGAFFGLTVKSVPVLEPDRRHAAAIPAAVIAVARIGIGPGGPGRAVAWLAFPCAATAVRRRGYATGAWTALLEIARGRRASGRLGGLRALRGRG